VGFEPTNGGFADLSLGPLGYRAKLRIIANSTVRSQDAYPRPDVKFSTQFQREGSKYRSALAVKALHRGTAILGCVPAREPLPISSRLGIPLSLRARTERLPPVASG